MTTTAPAETWLTPAEVAAELRCSDDTIHRAIRSGALPALRHGRLLRISRTHLDAFIAANTQHGDQLAPRRRRRRSA